MGSNGTESTVSESLSAGFLSGQRLRKLTGMAASDHTFDLERAASATHSQIPTRSTSSSVTSSDLRS